MTTPADPFAILRTRKYVALLVLAAVLGVVISFLVYWYLKLITDMQTWVFTDLPKGLGFHGEPPWWPLLPLAVAGAVVGATIRYLPGRGGHSPADGFKAGGVAQPNELPGIFLAALAGLGLGAVIGPEAPLIALGGGLAFLAVKLARRDVPTSTGAVIAATGSFAAISTLFGNPLAAAFLLLEASGLGGPMATIVLIPGLVGAGVGYLIFIGLNAWTGYGTFSLAIPNLPPAPHLDLAQFGWALAIGAAAAVVSSGIRRLALFLRPHVERQLVLLTLLAGLVIAGLAIAFGEATGKPSSAVLFSGQAALTPLLEHAASYTVGTLVLLVVCKGIAYSLSLCSFRGGPTFPGMFIGAAGGIALSHLPGLPMIAGAAIGIGAMTAGMLQLPMTAVLITTLFLGTDGITMIPLVIVAVVVSFVLSKWLAGPPTAPQVPEPAEAAVPPQVRLPCLTLACTYDTGLRLGVSTVSDTFDVIMAAYQAAEVAERDFDALVRLVKDRAVRSEGVILVERDADGQVRISQTGDHLGRKGLGWGGGVGLVVGLFSPPMLASIVVGGAAGALVGRFARHKVDSGIEHGLGDKLQPGTAVIIAVVDGEDRLAAEQALAGSSAKSVAPMGRKSLGELKAALAEAAGKFSPDRTVLPIPDRNFGGAMGRTIDRSVPDWSMIPGPQAPDGAPNVLIVLIDDAGFGNPDTFGGPVSTPNLTRVQQMGLTYNRFHVTAVCSPTRAALLTGRNHHRVGFGSIAEYPGPYPGYTAAAPRSCAALPRILQENGYVTGGFGKWHLTPDNVQGPAGPFSRWPQAWGFDHWWGFLSGAAGQYDPIITQDNSTLGVSEARDGEPYYFPDDLTDKAVEWLHGVRAQDATKPWLMYYSTGCAHAPHHVGRAWADKYRGRFDGGWDKLREETFERQKRLGIIPADAKLTRRPDLFPAWDSLNETEKKLYARQMEVFAGFCENADWNVGRLLDSIEEMGDLDNTLIFYIWGDNGSSMEGTITGSFNEMTFLNALVLDPERQLRLIEQYGGIEALGGPHTAPHYAAAWAHAGNTPFQWGKQVASHLGGARDPMVVAWPTRIRASRDVRAQFTHCIDVAPTVLEAVGLPEPKTVDGIGQEPMDGTSFAHTFADANADERHTVQYFEMFGSRALYKDGWWACAKLDRAPWDFSPETLRRFAPGVYDPEQDVWELYYLPDDFSQACDLAAEHPDKLAELKELWWAEAERNRVLPLLGGMSVLFGDLPPLPTVTRFTFAGDVQNVQRGMVPRVYGRSYAIEAELSVPEGGAEGVIVANADFIGGFGLWVDGGGLLHHTYSFLGVETYKQVSTEAIPTGAVTVKMLFAADEAKPGTGGTVTLYANGKVIGEGKMPHTVPIAFSSYAGMDIGRDNGLVVDLAYKDKAPYPFTGIVKKVVFDLKPATHEDEQALHEHAQVHGIGEGAAG